MESAPGGRDQLAFTLGACSKSKQPPNGTPLRTSETDRPYSSSRTEMVREDTGVAADSGMAGIKNRAMAVRFEEHRRDGARPASPEEIDRRRSHRHGMSVAQQGQVHVNQRFHALCKVTSRCLAPPEGTLCPAYRPEGQPLRKSCNRGRTEERRPPRESAPTEERRRDDRRGRGAKERKIYGQVGRDRRLSGCSLSARVLRYLLRDVP